jgi:hypothetical protein
LALALALTVILALGCAAVLTTAHARDRYWINIAAGSWMAQAWSANQGELYPPLRDDAGNFAGTRYMPLHIVAHAALARATGEYLLSGRIIGYAAAGAWLLGIFALARQHRAPRLFAGALAASVLLSPVGIQALCTVRSDGLALALQLWALWLAGRIGRERGLALAALAGLLCALAVLSKLTAMWAAIAIVLWLPWRNRGAWALFIATAVIVVAGAMALAYWASDGRLAANFLAATDSGWQGWGSVLGWSQRRLLGFVSEWSPTTWVLAPAALLALLLAAAQRDLRLIHVAWLACCASFAVMFADIGVGENHIIEFAAITAALAADLWSRAGAASRESRPAWTVAQMLLALAVAWSSIAVLNLRLRNDIADALAILRGGRISPQHDPRAFDAVLADRTFLSDDPSLAVLLNRRPVVSDAFLLRRLHGTHPEWTAELVERIARRDFDAVVLLREPDPQSWWYRELFLGAPVIEAVNQHYQFDQRVGDHLVYLRKDQ